MHPSTGRALAVAMLLATRAAAQEPGPACVREPAEASPAAEPETVPPPPLPEPQAEPKPAPAPGPGVVPAPSAEGATWIDDSHRTLERGLTDLTERLDRVFGEDRRLDLEQPGTYLRFRGELRADDRRNWSPRVALRARLQLPAMTRWLAGLQLVFSGESRGDPAVRRLEDPGDPGFSPSLRAEQAALELRVDPLRTRATVLQAATGIRLRFPFEYLFALRFRQRLDLGWSITSRFTQEGFWMSRDGFGEKTQLDLDRPVAAHTQVRWNNAGFVTGPSRGYEWATELGVAHELEALRTAAYLAFAVSGFGLPKAEVELYRVFTRVRRDVWRRWLFVELEPEIGWRTTPERGRQRVHAITARLEVIVDGRTPPGAARAPPADPPPPAPR